MLDKDTKKRIDDCRDILVGKIPDPKSQIEQITIALIYKFMDDMDRETVELGGAARFFSGEFAQYAWANLFNPQNTSADVVRLYGEAIEKMELNPSVPQLFRDIFKNAYLPYRDPETLRLFLKTIGEFEYSHSEKLGDAFEYLLSVMGSQGDAGQFRTPRHIIDFIVALMDPTKDDVIIDPACGTAGFLISAYKHILKENSSNYVRGKDKYAFELHGVKQEELTADAGKKYKGDKLTADERNKVTRNIKGYDISPDMVRMSLVNLFLHDFKDPHIFEYDSLSSEDRWGEEGTLFLANPPFMTPKGGIRPHKRFSVQSNRAEVLFVDYMAEHLTKFGRAGIIVPEGVIFQSGTAYKNLRKLLVDSGYLLGVISLPAGVFQPYSGVKTSILWLDKKLAAKTDDILFVKVQNDGFDLGAQRRPIKDNDLPEIFQKLSNYKKDLTEGKALELKDDAQLWTAAKTDIAESGDYNLSGERYKVVREFNSNYQHFSLGELCDIYNGSTPSRKNEDYWNNGSIPWFTVEDIRKGGRIISETIQHITEKALKETSVKVLPKNTVLLCCTASVGEFAFTEIELTTNQQFNGLVVKPEFESRLNAKFLFIISSQFKSELLRISGQTSFNFVSVGVLKTLEIPLPPLSVQEEIVAEVDGYQKIIDGARMVVDNYQPRIDIDPEWPMVELGEVCEVKAGGTPSRNKNEFWDGQIPWYSSGELNELFTIDPKEYITEKGLRNSNASLFPAGSLLVGMYDTAAFKMSILDREATFNQAVCGIKPNDKILLKFLYLYFSMNRELYLGQRVGVRQRNLSKGFISSLQVPLIDISIQEKIISKMENELQLVNSTKQLIELFELKIKERISKVWGVEKNNKPTKAYAEPEVKVRMVAEE